MRSRSSSIATKASWPWPTTAISPTPPNCAATTSETEVIVHLVARSGARNLQGALGDALNQVEGAYSLLVLTRDELYAIRDPHGFRPLSLGRLGDAWLVASETCAFDLLGAEYVRVIEPGELVRISKSG